uniref:Pentacotripeptide-repeat region of PRORP domain-containing protein n=2 Tax=Nymphaea colorata TaxID=210225 RepID=A0A5K0W732_9MAGN
MHENFIWNTIIRRCAQAKNPQRALYFYTRMRRKGRLPDSFTFPFALKVSADLFDSRKGQEIHCLALKTGHASAFYLQTNLALFYASCGEMKSAHQVFEEMPKSDAIAWNVMITGCLRSGCFVEAVNLYSRMKLEGCRADGHTLVSIGSACANIGAIGFGKYVHGYACKLGLTVVVPLLNALVDMYGKCGCLVDAHALFDEVSERTLVSWSIMMNVYAIQGRASDVFDAFSGMKKQGFSPDEIVFTSVLCACSHAGLLEEGKRWFRDMTEIYGISPTIQHYGCMVDLLGRAGRLKEAYELIQRMPVKPDAAIWRALAAACLVSGELDLAEDAAKHLIELNSSPDGGDFVLLSNVYARLGRWEDVAWARKGMELNVGHKTASCSYIELNNIVHGFLSGNVSNPESHMITDMLSQMAEKVLSETL